MSSKFHLSVCFQKTQNEEVGVRSNQVSRVESLAARLALRIRSLVTGGAHKVVVQLLE